MQTVAPAPIAPATASQPGPEVPRIELLPDERHSVAALAHEYARASASLDARRSLQLAALMAHELPRSLRRLLTEFRLAGSPNAGFLISGLLIDENALGPTPMSYQERPDRPELRHADAVLCLVGSLLGEPFSFSSQQRGRLLLDLFPVPGHELDQLGSGSTAMLDWHTEDAFHPHRADWMILLGLRNHDAVPTTFAAMEDIELSDEHRAVLFEKRFAILPDQSHTKSFNVATGAADAAEAAGADQFRRIDTMANRPEPIALLEGDPAAPWLRVDPPFMHTNPLDPQAAEAQDALLTAIEAKLTDVVIGRGDLFVIDNKRAVHGRRPFTPRYDGTDRWLKRINLTADLRRSAGSRHGEHGRAVA
ncbi:guanitoxin biosynthesis L-enduracididine beta-hydroxylase GntD [Streptomyces katrae]|uniref:guanitoxin biosynthesis L-enduracididine beta-hydroxylase GntD n=1 Tax=Streptomyces katrae TaxID=68223 RepID=UPI00068FD103|nr:guanitoxin biosynthesis L-enduracididine beta-hydroxylase GntD [Streptomyces katrae]